MLYFLVIKSKYIDSDRNDYILNDFPKYLLFQSPSLSDNTIDTSGHDDASSSGAKDDDDDDDDDDVNDDKIDGQICGDPEKLKAFNVRI